MERAKQFNEVVDELTARLKLMEDGGVQFAGLGPKPALEILFAGLADCTLCPLHKEKESIAEINWGLDGLRAEVAFVLDTELPKESKERELLTKMINAMGLKLEETYITSTVKCVTPEPGSASGQDFDEAIKSCKGILQRELAHISPTIVVALGAKSTKALIDNPLPFESLRGRFQDPGSVKGGSTKDASGYQIMPTYPPSLLIEDEDKKRDAWTDLKKVMARLKLKPAK